MNGIIIDDEHIHERAFRDTVKPYNIDLNHQAYHECCSGKTDRAGYEYIARKYSVTLPINALLKQKSAIYTKHFPTNKKAYSGVIELIYTLAENFVLGLTSSSPRKEVDLIINSFEINHKFKVTISADDVKKGKPDPEPYLLTAKKLGFKPEECVVIEDSPNGIISAKSAGCYCIGVITTHKKENLKRADLIVDTVSEISSQVIQKMFS